MQINKKCKILNDNQHTTESKCFSLFLGFMLFVCLVRASFLSKRLLKTFFAFVIILCYIINKTSFIFKCKINTLEYLILIWQSQNSKICFNPTKNDNVVIRVQQDTLTGTTTAMLNISPHFCI